MKKRVGKIARLPHEVRQQINEMIQDGVPYEQIIQTLQQRGYPDFNPQNLTNWKEGGFQDWLREQERLDAIQLEREATTELVKNLQGPAFTDAAIQLASFHLFQVLRTFNPEDLKKQLAERPRCYFDIINAFLRLLKTRLHVNKIFDDLDHQQFMKGITQKLSPLDRDMVEEILNSHPHTLHG